MSDVMRKVLLVEDNEMNREMLSRRLVRKGFEVAIAVDGLEGVAMASAQPPDLILMDMSLPGIDGWEATRRLKAQPGTRAVPVIALTAHAMSDDREKALAAGCDDFDTKPVDLERLLGKMQALLVPRAPSATVPSAAAPSATAALPVVETVLTLPAVTGSLPALQAALDQLCLQCGATPDARADLQVALDEVCANVFKHAYAGLEPGLLRLALQHHATQAGAPAFISLCFSDWGQPFNPLLQQVPDLTASVDDRPLGGLGIHLVRQLTDHQTYLHTPADGNQLTVVKRLG